MIPSSPARALAFVLLAGCSRAPTAAATGASAAAASVTAPPASARGVPPPSRAAAETVDPLELEARRQWEVEGKREDIVYVPTPQVVVDRMLDVAKVTQADVVYDLGCGDGRIVVTAAKKLGARGVGFDLNPDRVRDARAGVKAAGIESLASIRWANVFSVDLEPATVVMLYLLPELNVRLLPQLEKLRKGSRVISHDFGMEGVAPDGHWTMTAPEFVTADGQSAYRDGVPEDGKHYKERKHDIYLWVAPFKRGSAKH